MVAYPRLGRNSELTSFSRSRRAFGVITVPRAGRSDPSSLDNGYRFHDLPSDTDYEFYYVEPDNFLDYEGDCKNNFIKQIIFQYCVKQK